MRNGPDSTSERILQFANVELAKVPEELQEEVLQRVSDELQAWREAVKAGHERRSALRTIDFRPARGETIR